MRMGKYEIHELLGNGAMGEVYRGTDVSLDREVAIKALRPDLAADAAFVDRFRSEAKTAAKLNHVNVAAVYAFEEIDGRCLLVMEFVRGQTLDNMLRKFGPMAPNGAVALLRQVLAGIGHAHSRGIAHRDIKPANIFVTNEGVAKVLDFGIARVLGTARQTREGRLIGTYEYMAPERILDKPTDLRSDIYSLGILMYEMLAGKLPFEGQSEYELMRSQMERPAPRLEEFGVSVPAGLQAAVHKCIEKDPNNRFQTVTEFDAAIAPYENAANTPVSPSVKHTRIGTASELAGLEAQRPGNRSFPPVAAPRTVPVAQSKPAESKSVLTPFRMALAAVVLALGGLGWVALQKFSGNNGSDGEASPSQISNPVKAPAEITPENTVHVPARPEVKPAAREVVSPPGPDLKKQKLEEAAEQARKQQEIDDAKAAEARAAEAARIADARATEARAAELKAGQIRDAIGNADRELQRFNWATALSQTSRALSLEGNSDGSRDSDARRERDKILKDCQPLGTCQKNSN